MVAVLEANEESSKAIGLHPPYDLLLLNQLQFSLSQLVYFGILEKLEHRLAYNNQFKSITSIIVVALTSGISKPLSFMNYECKINKGNVM